MAINPSAHPASENRVPAELLTAANISLSASHKMGSKVRSFSLQTNLIFPCNLCLSTENFDSNIKFMTDLLTNSCFGWLIGWYDLVCSFVLWSVFTALILFHFAFFFSFLLFYFVSTYYLEICI